jgi:predicted N-acetyltransferase YhbS
MSDVEQVQIVPESRLSAVLDARIKSTLVACFPKDAAVFSRTRAWHGSAPAFSAIAAAGALVVGHVGVVERTIRVGDTPLRVGGVQNVAVLPASRGQGLMRRMLEASMEEARRRGYDAGLLFTGPELLAAYGRCGWIGLGERPVVRVDESGQELRFTATSTMWIPLARDNFPAGLVHLNGNDW